MGAWTVSPSSSAHVLVTCLRSARFTWRCLGRDICKIRSYQGNQRLERPLENKLSSAKRRTTREWLHVLTKLKVSHLTSSLTKWFLLHFLLVSKAWTPNPKLVRQGVRRYFFRTGCRFWWIWLERVWFSNGNKTNAVIGSRSLWRLINLLDWVSHLLRLFAFVQLSSVVVIFKSNSVY